ncbi:hypothetical protein LTR56_020454 [Elasticomyces elasticus]|nr:hypothetical protein LTR56_020454 [Elasticomyces elasticus]KAK3645824.1 hypothetical protein LTR22_014592 [Elasticomyces elasticus]KAK4910565.1 hypothetical protein LTR49_020769 [Elasticomyces elasticus]KAK5742293.1 hypothetical protein LTS12_024287 [Elasticomyces elasticus]
MGLSGDVNEMERKPTFSNDVLRLELSGPDQEHLSVIDVPGIFKSTTEGVTTKTDIKLVRNIVKGYMDNPRSVMLAVVPANVDVATQEILELAAEADVHGDRTLGVLTKPDLVDRGGESGVVDLLEGRTRRMKLGWHIIRNPGQPVNHGAGSRKRKWASMPCDSASRKCFPQRNSSAEQMAYLTQLATRFQRLVSYALNANHGADEAFEKYPRLRIAPAVMSRMKIFSDEMAKYGQTYTFMSRDSKGSSSIPLAFIDDSDTEPAPGFFENRKEDDLVDLVDTLHLQESLPHPRHGDMKDWLLAVFEGNRGFELGNFQPLPARDVHEKAMLQVDGH